MESYIPEGYRSNPDLKRTQLAIKCIKDTFERALAQRLNLLRVSAPLFVAAGSGLNDDLTGWESPVRFTYPESEGVLSTAEIVQSLAKWKRFALRQYDFDIDTGLYTDMDAIRPNEIPDATHSIYVDQWDWEKVIRTEDRTKEYLRETVREIFAALCDLASVLSRQFCVGDDLLPKEISFITSQALEDRFPAFSPQERERAIAQEKKLVFVEEIGYPLHSGKPHDLRSPDYDDWRLNGDLLAWSPILDDVLELSSMGIRVSPQTLREQLSASHHTERSHLPYHQTLLAGDLPQTIGGGIGQSRLCMFFLQKTHIGEVQASLWPAAMRQNLAARGIHLL